MKLRDWEPASNSKLCSQNFEETSFFMLQGKKLLLDDVIPTILSALLNHFQPQVQQQIHIYAFLEWLRKYLLL